MDRPAGCSKTTREPFCTVELLALFLGAVITSCGGSTFSSAGGSDAATDATADVVVDGRRGPDGGRASDDGGRNSDAGGNADAAVTCAVDPPGSTFTFHVHNGGSAHLGLAYGCGANAPIVLSTTAGSLGIGAESANPCGSTCDQAYQGNAPQTCSDCGSGVGADLAAGATVDIPWDRRVYVAHAADSRCVGGTSGVSCAMGQTVPPSTSQKGTLTVCSAGSSSGAPGGGSCSQSEAVDFTLDLTKSEGVIEVH